MDNENRTIILNSGHSNIIEKSSNRKRSPMKEQSFTQNNTQNKESLNFFKDDKSIIDNVDENIKLRFACPTYK
jgi:hypothetical protein